MDLWWVVALVALIILAALVVHYYAALVAPREVVVTVTRRVVVTVYATPKPTHAITTTTFTVSTPTVTVRRTKPTYTTTTWSWTTTLPVQTSTATPAAECRVLSVHPRRSAELKLAPHTELKLHLVGANASDSRLTVLVGLELDGCGSVELSKPVFRPGEYPVVASWVEYKPSGSCDWRATVPLVVELTGVQPGEQKVYLVVSYGLQAAYLGYLLLSCR